jgi:hypothetical protein
MHSGRPVKIRGSRQGSQPRREGLRPEDIEPDRWRISARVGLPVQEIDASVGSARTDRSCLGFTAGFSGPRTPVRYANRIPGRIIGCVRADLAYTRQS